MTQKQELPEGRDQLHHAPPEEVRLHLPVIPEAGPVPVPGGDQGPEVRKRGRGRI